jgi:hypothetical protein
MVWHETSIKHGGYRIWESHRRGYEEFYLMGFNAMRSVESPFCLLLALCWFLAWLIFQPWRLRRRIPPKHWLTFKELCSVISHWLETFIHCWSFGYILNSTPCRNVIKTAIGFLTLLYTDRRKALMVFEREKCLFTSGIIPNGYNLA